MEISLLTDITPGLCQSKASEGFTTSLDCLFTFFLRRNSNCSARVWWVYGSLAHWSSDLSPGSVSLGRCGRVKDIFYCVGPSHRHCVLAVEQLSPYSRPGLTVISPPALLTNRPDCFSTIWDRQVRAQGCPGTELIYNLQILLLLELVW